MSDSNTSSGGMGLTGILFLIFLVLKLTGVGAVANWSWWAVTSPLWIGAIFWTLVLGVLMASDLSDGPIRRRPRQNWKDMIDKD